MPHTIREIAEQYYRVVGKKESGSLEPFLHPNVKLKGPLGGARGREAVAKTTGHFMQMIESASIRTAFANENQALVVYDSVIPSISQSFPGTSLLTFEAGKIVQIELFYDGSPFLTQRKEIFGE